MVDARKKSRKRKEEFDFGDEVKSQEPTKDEYKLADWMRKNVPIKRTKFEIHSVEYFTGSKAVDIIFNSGWTEVMTSNENENEKVKKSKVTPIFYSRDDIIVFLDRMLHNKLFHRAKKVPISDRELSMRKSKRDVGVSSSAVTLKPVEAENQKKRCKVRLEMHMNQRFEDNLDAYVWLYQPTPLHYWIVGTLLVFGGIVLCMFPLWPPILRQGVYYTSIAAIGFLALILILAVFRHILFCMIWIFTLGRHHFWLLPNLTEDVGFVASFIPVYQYEYKGRVQNDKKDKDSDAERESEQEVDVEVKKCKQKHKSKKIVKNDKVESQTQKVEEKNDTVEEQIVNNKDENGHSSSSSDRDFEMVNAGDVDNNS